jgi:hypothetical protein
MSETVQNATLYLRLEIEQQIRPALSFTPVFSSRLQQPQVTTGFVKEMLKRKFTLIVLELEG